MDEETKKLLEENLVLNKANNQMLNKLIVFQRWNQLIRAISWLFIILTSLGAVYFIQKNIGSLIGVYTGGANVSNAGSITEILGNNGSLTDLFKSTFK